MENELADGDESNTSPKASQSYTGIVTQQLHGAINLFGWTKMILFTASSFGCN
jgi:hypothetical protein